MLKYSYSTLPFSLKTFTVLMCLYAFKAEDVHPLSKDGSNILNS